ncbi:MAG: DUF3459 domain-containing protein [Acidimicrobiia bacterium]|nr:DUF3459 domain-containing protein [Acidimicrobiia bacterium]
MTEPDGQRDAGHRGDPWWHGAVIYQIYPRSFADSNGDGVGDLPGIRRRLEHVASLGVDAIWLSPFYRSPMADFGYDVADHCDVDPVFGTLEDARGLIDDAHRLGLAVLVDFVPNHTSDQHPWFVASRSSRSNPMRHWYTWRDAGRGPNGVPNNWRAAFTGEAAWVRDDTGQLRPRWGLEATDQSTSAWTWDEATGQFYLHTFLPQQPDLDWRNPEVVAAQHDVLCFWLDAGVDGFRVDAIITIGKPEGLPDADPDLALIPEAGLTDEEFARSQVRDLRALVDAYRPDRILLGEVGGIDASAIRRYVAHDGFHLAFDFPPMFDRWRADRWRRHIDEAEAAHVDGEWPTWVLSNHDTPRHADRFGSEARARAAAVLLVGLRGCVVLYAGEELGLVDAEIAPDDRLDPGGRDGCRAPLPWTDAADHGWPPQAWLPFPANAETRNVERLEADPSSILHLYRRLLAARRSSPALRSGSFTWLADQPEGVLAWLRTVDPGSADPEPSSRDADRLVTVNFTESPAVVTTPSGNWVLVASGDGDGSEVDQPWDGRLGPDGAVIAQRR